MITTGKYSQKLYRCRECGHEQMQGTNHWGECYSWGNCNKCPACGWKHPMDVTIWDCVETAPNGYSKPLPWKIVKLSEILEEV